MNYDIQKMASSNNKKPVLFLHIGYPKTGSTALQACLEKNRKLLMKNGICYSDHMGKISNHANLMISVMAEYLKKNYAPIRLSSWANYLSAYIEPPTNIINRMKSVFYKNDCHILIISNEFLAGPLFSVLNVLPNDDKTMRPSISEQRNYIMKYLKEMFKEFDIKIVCYLRRQDDYVESFYNQQCKTVGSCETYPLTSTKKFSEQTECICGGFNVNSIMRGVIEREPPSDFFQTLSAWAEIYDKGNIIVRPYEKSQLVKGIEYDFFVNVLGCSSDFVSNLEVGEKVNTGISTDIIEYKIAAKLFDLDQEFIELDSRPALAYLKNNNKKNILTAKQAKRLLDYCKEDNEKIAREYLGREDGILFYDLSREEKDDYPGLSMQTTLDISRELVLMLKNKTMYEKVLDDLAILVDRKFPRLRKLLYGFYKYQQLFRKEISTK